MCLTRSLNVSEQFGTLEHYIQEEIGPSLEGPRNGQLTAKRLRRNRTESVTQGPKNKRNYRRSKKIESKPWAISWESWHSLYLIRFSKYLSAAICGSKGLAIMLLQSFPTHHMPKIIPSEFWILRTWKHLNYCLVNVIAADMIKG